MNSKALCLSGTFVCVVVLAFSQNARANASASSTVTILSPTDYQIVQQDRDSVGLIPVEVKTTSSLSQGDTIEYRILLSNESTTGWKTLEHASKAESLRAEISVEAGGWYRLEVRHRKGEDVVAMAEVAHVGVGEIFVVAGQSNSANHGEEKQCTRTGRVVAFDGKQWRLANDPQPGASGQGGSFLPPLGDALADQFDVPIGFVACGIGATSVREWLPQGISFPNPPTIESRVRRVSASAAGGEVWESDGDAFRVFINRAKPLGTQGFRAVLWHQGESDANQRDASRTLAGNLYREYLAQIIRQSRHELMWDVPWFVAQVSYHVPGDESSADIRDAQVSLWKDGIAIAGPDSDSLKGDLRERNGQGVHFSGKGLQAHADLWAKKIIPWLQMQ